MRYCIDNGWLASASEPISDFEFDFFSGSLMQGCNRLQCTSCGLMVKNRIGWKLNQKPANLPQIYVSDSTRELENSGAISRDAECRLYFCACEILTQTEYIQFDFHQSYAWDDWHRTIKSWRCIGHPPFTLPGFIDGVRIEINNDWPKMVQESLSGLLSHRLPQWLPRYPGAWMHRLYHLMPKDIQKLIRQVLAQSLQAEDIRVRLGALHIFYQEPVLVSTATLIQFIEHAPELWRNIANPFPEEQPAHTLVQVTLSNKLTQDPELIPVARNLLCQSNPCIVLIGRMMQCDRDWVLEHLVDIFKATPTTKMAGDLLYCMKRLEAADLLKAVLTLGVTHLVPLEDYLDLVRQLAPGVDRIAVKKILLEKQT